MRTLRDDLIGEMSYEYGWVKSYSIPFFGETAHVQLVISCYEADEIESAQRIAFTRFDANKDRYMRLAETKIFEHYQSVCDECRERFGVEFADKMAPIIKELQELKPLVNPTQVVIQQSFGTGDSVVGLLLTCSWEPELGLAVKFIGDAVSEVGPQDIVL